MRTQTYTQEYSDLANDVAAFFEQHFFAFIVSQCMRLLDKNYRSSFKITNPFSHFYSFRSKQFFQMNTHTFHFGLQFTIFLRHSFRMNNFQVSNDVYTFSQFNKLEYEMGVMC